MSPVGKPRRMIPPGSEEKNSSARKATKTQMPYQMSDVRIEKMEPRRRESRRKVRMLRNCARRMAEITASRAFRKRGRRRRHARRRPPMFRSEEHTSELQSQFHL